MICVCSGLFEKLDASWQILVEVRALQAVKAVFSVHSNFRLWSFLHSPAVALRLCCTGLFLSSVSEAGEL